MMNPSFFLSIQEDQSKLSDQQEAVKWAQNPYPLYATVNVRPNVSGDDFAGTIRLVYFSVINSESSMLQLNVSLVLTACQPITQN